MKRVLIIGVLLFSLSCNSTETQSEKDCGNNSIPVLAHTLNSGLKPLILRNKNLGDTSFVIETIDALNELNNIESDLVWHAGGLDPDTGVLLYGCKTIPKSEIANIKGRADSLIQVFQHVKSTYSGTKEQNILKEIIKILDENILNESISNKQYSEILIHILVQHNLMLTKMLDIYIFPEKIQKS